jgi:histidine triad (HIT) family protein
MEKNCIFCQIAHGQTSTEILYQTDTLVVFKDINPHAPVHLLFVPKVHIRSINDLTDADHEILSELVMVAKEMAREHGVAGDISPSSSPDRRLVIFFFEMVIFPMNCVLRGLLNTLILKIRA